MSATDQFQTVDEPKGYPDVRSAKQWLADNTVNNQIWETEQQVIRIAANGQVFVLRHKGWPDHEAGCKDCHTWEPAARMD